MSFVGHLFGYVCASDHVWELGGAVLPFCQRCTGLYVGGFAALVAYVVLRPRVSSALIWLHGTLLVGMIPFGYHWVSQTGSVRTATGFVFACGIVYYCSLLPLRRFRGRPRDDGRMAFSLLFASLVALLAAVSYGGSATAAVISILGVLGLMSFVALVSASAWYLVRP